MAAVLNRVAMPIVDTNLHSSMVDEDGNERVPESILLGTVSEDGRGHVGDITVTGNNTCHKQCVANTSLICYAAC